MWHSNASSPCVQVARTAMATRFEVVLHGDRPEALRAMAEEALEEIAQVEGWLSPFRPDSALTRLHAQAGSGPVRVDPRLFQFLIRARALSQATGGAFDPTIGALLRAWGFQGGERQAPDPHAIQRARACCGWEWIELDPAAGTVELLRPGLEIHPGAMGKGYALDRAMALLVESGARHGLIHGGTSTVCAFGSAPDGGPWIVALPSGPDSPGGPGLHTRVPLQDTTLSVSAVWGRRGPSHVLDPRTGEPASVARMAAVVLPSATDSDAWSTALLVGGDSVAGKVPGQHWWQV